MLTTLAKQISLYSQQTSTRLGSTERFNEIRSTHTRKVHRLCESIRIPCRNLVRRSYIVVASSKSGCRKPQERNRVISSPSSATNNELGRDVQGRHKYSFSSPWLAGLARRGGPSELCRGWTRRVRVAASYCIHG